MYPGIADRMQKEITNLAPSTMKSRSSLPLKGNTLYGLEAPSWLLSQPSNRCGSANKSMMNLAHPLSTENVSNVSILIRLVSLFKQITFGKNLNKLFSSCIGHQSYLSTIFFIQSIKI